MVVQTHHIGSCFIKVQPILEWHLLYRLMERIINQDALVIGEIVAGISKTKKENVYGMVQANWGKSSLLSDNGFRNYI